MEGGRLLEEQRVDVTARCEGELRGLRSKNSELLRRAAAPDAAAFGKLLGSDGLVTCVVIVPQPNHRFASPVLAVEVDRRPGPTMNEGSAGAAAGEDLTGTERAVGSGEVSVEWRVEGLRNGRAYTFRARARNANGW